MNTAEIRISEIREREQKALEEFNKVNPLIQQVEKDGFTLEIRKRGYFILLSEDGRITKKGIRLNKELKNYFEV